MNNRRPDYVTSLIFWLPFSLAAVAIRGVRWDEDYEFAQVVAGAVKYPAWHPLHHYAPGLFSLQHYILAPFLWFGPAVICGFRNVAMLWATAASSYLLGFALSRRALGGHLAAAFVLLEAHTAFYSSYPVHVWPHLYSNGPVGQGWALAGLALLMLGRSGGAGAMTGLMPMVHAGQWPPLLLCAAGGAFDDFRQGKWRNCARALLGGCIGIAACVAFWLVYRQYQPGPPPGFAEVPSAETIYRYYMTFFASHRAIPTGTIWLIVAGAAIVLPLAWRRDKDNRRTWGYALAYAGACVALAGGVALVHLALGPEIPPWLIGWMPYRLLNHLGPLLIAGCVAVLLLARGGTPLLAALLALGTLRAPLSFALPAGLYARYLGDASFLLFLLAGAALHALLPRTARAWAVLAVACAALALVHQFGAACFAIGVVLGWLFARINTLRHAQSPVLIALAACLVALLAQQGWYRLHLPITPQERALAAGYEPGAVLHVPPQQEGMQGKFGIPVMSDMATITWIPYRPDLGPLIYRVYRDEYGIGLAPEGP